MVTAFEVSPAINGGDGNVYASFPDCVKDDTCYFQKDSVMLIENGAKKCENKDPRQKRYKWFMKGDSITINGTKQLILSLTDKELQVTYSQLLKKVNYQYTMTYTNLR